MRSWTWEGCFFLQTLRRRTTCHTRLEAEEVASCYTSFPKLSRKWWSDARREHGKRMSGLPLWARPTPRKGKMRIEGLHSGFHHQHSSNAKDLNRKYKSRASNFPALPLPLPRGRRVHDLFSLSSGQVSTKLKLPTAMSPRAQTEPNPKENQKAMEDSEYFNRSRIQVAKEATQNRLMRCKTPS
jgi:hypothetical protein